MTNTPKEYLDAIKKFLELYQEDLLKIKHRTAGEIVRFRVSISELIHQINLWTKNLPELLVYELENQYIGMKFVVLEKYKEKTTTEICESLETQLCTTDIPSYILEPLMFGIREIKERDKK